MKTLIALDIDGVLNDRFDHERLIALFEQQITCRKTIGEQAGVRFMDRGNYVNLESLALLQTLVAELDATVVGISSWFTTRRSAVDVGAFLGIDIHHAVKDTGGGEGRVRALGDFIEEHRPERLVILDDQPYYYDAYSFTPYHVKPLRRLNESHLAQAREIAQQPIDWSMITMARKIQNIIPARQQHERTRSAPDTQ